MKAYIIFCNDEIYGVVVENEKYAKRKMASLKRKHYNKNRIRSISKNDYDFMCFWHVHEVPIYEIKK